MTSLKNWLDRLLGRDKGTAEDASATMGEPTEAMTAGTADEAMGTPTPGAGVDRERTPPPGTG